MSDLPEGLSETYFFKHPDGRMVELLNFRRQPEISFVRKPRTRRRVPGSVRSRMRPQIIERDGMDCHYCKCEMKLPTEFDTNNRKMATIEHVVPQSLGGPNTLENLVLACLDCNNAFGSTYMKCRCEFCNNARYKYGGNR